jgi:murein DD-endopeptidase MepM/ murein hydrolase activator NlpD
VAVTATTLGAVNASAGGIVGNTTDRVRDTTGTVTDTVDDTTGTVTDTVDDTTGTVTDTTGTVTDTTGTVTDTVTGGGSTSTGTGTTDTSTGTTTTTDDGTYDETTDTGGGGGGAGGAAGPGGAGGSGGRPNGKPRLTKEEREARERQAHRHSMNVPTPPLRKPDGTPTNQNPGLTIADFGPAPLGVPSFIIGQFEIPPFLLPIYQACGTQYGIPWQVLASINKIETAFGTNLNVSYAGAQGWMQFMPATWDAYGVDANGDGKKDPYNPVDAICAAARYLKASGGESNLRQAIFAYNHADWYVDEVLLYAEQYGKLPEDLVGSLTGLTQGARFPVAAKARYADDIAERQAAERAEKRGGQGNVAEVVSSSPTRRGINIYSKEDAPVVAVNDGRIKRMGHSKELGDYIVLEDDYGNRFTYAQLGKVAKTYPVPKRHAPSIGGRAHGERGKQGQDEKGKQDQKAKQGEKSKQDMPGMDGNSIDRGDDRSGPENTEDTKRRMFALPQRAHNWDRALMTGQLDQIMASKSAMSSYFGSAPKFNRKSMVMRPLRKGSEVVSGTVLGRVGKTNELAPHLNFAIRPAGKGAPRIDPKPILDGWKLLEATAIYRAVGENPFEDSGRSNVTRDLLMPKPQLERRVLADPRLNIYACGRNDIRTGLIDQRVLAGMEYLANNGFELTITSLQCGHGTYTTSGNVSAHSTGDAMDIAMVNGIPITGHQGSGSITEMVIKSLMQLQGTMAPDQIISLMSLGGPSFAMSDHYDHIHAGWTPTGGPTKVSKELTTVLKPEQWKKLVGRIAEINNPRVPQLPSKAATKAKKPAERAYIGGD